MHSPQPDQRPSSLLGWWGWIRCLLPSLHTVPSPRGTQCLAQYPTLPHASDWRISISVSNFHFHFCFQFPFHFHFLLLHMPSNNIIEWTFERNVFTTVGCLISLVPRLFPYTQQWKAGWTWTQGFSLRSCMVTESLPHCSLSVMIVWNSSCG